MENVYKSNYTGIYGRTESKFDKFCFWFTTIDLLFLPYFTVVSVSFSVPIIALWMVLNSKKLFYDKEASIYVLMAGAMFFSLIVGLVYNGNVRFETTYTTSVKRFLQYIICFGYYFFYKSYFRKKYVEISKIIFIFIMYMSVFALFFLLYPIKYAELKMAIHPVDNHTQRYLANLISYRFNYLWTDPNNIAYLVCGIFFWYIYRNECTFNKKLIIFLLTLLILFSTVSNGGIIIFSFMLFANILKWIVNKHKFIIKIKSLYFVLFLSACIIAIFTFTQTANKIYNTFIIGIISRLSYYLNTNNLSGGRINDLNIAIKYLNPIFIIVGSGKEGFTYENGHLYWICMYGFISYIGFIWLMFRKTKTQLWRDYIWVIPFFVAYTMNIAIGEFKWMAIYLMLMAYSRYGIKRNLN